MLVVRYMHVFFTSEDVKMQDIWNLTRIPELKRCVPTQRPDGCPIVAVNLSTAVITL